MIETIFDFNLSWTSVTLSLLAVTIVGKLLSYWAWVRQESQNLPGPNPIPFVGNLFSLDLEEFLVSLERITLPYLDSRKLSQIWLLDRNVVFTFDIAHVKEVVLKSVWRKQGPQSIHLYKFLGKKSLVSDLDPAEWKHHRSMFSKPFHFAKLKEMVPDMTRKGEEFVSRVSKLGDNAPFLFLPNIKKCTMDVIGLTAFGEDFENVTKVCEEGDTPIAAAFGELLEQQTQRTFSMNPLSRNYWIPTPQNRRHKEASDYLRSVVRNAITKRKEQQAAGEELHPDFLTAVLEYGGELSPEALEDNLITILFAGYDTTSVTLSFTFLLLAQNPHVEEKLVAEIKENIGDDELTYDNISKVPYATAVIKEAMRLHTPVPLTSRHLVDDVKLGDVHLKKDQFVWIPIWRIHRDPDNYSKPDEMIPERWLSKEEGGTGERIAPYAWMPFSGGQRNCLGQRFAMLEATILLATIVRKLSFKLEEGYVLKPEVTAIQQPNGGLPMRVSVRK